MNQWRKGLAMRHLFHLWPSFDVCGNFQKFFRVLLSTLLRCAINISDRWPVHTLKSHAPKNCFVCCTKRPRRLFRAQQTCRCVSAIPSGRIINERILPPAVLWQSAQNIRRDFFFFVNYCPSNDRSDCFQSAAFDCKTRRYRSNLLGKFRPDGRWLRGES